LRVVVIGLGTQGKKRAYIAGNEVVYTIDPLNSEADFKDIRDVPLNDYDAALCCIPDEPKAPILRYLIANKKDILVEKPLWVASTGEIDEIETLANKHNVVCYTAYNHRFEPHFVRMKELIQSGTLGRIYSCRMFYGNGTARIVRDSAWRDQGSGVIHDLGSHLLDTLLFFFGEKINDVSFKLRSCNNFENRAPDYAAFSYEAGDQRFDCEVSLISWRNSFSCDIYAENGSAHINSLCKWGPSSFTTFERVIPSGLPNEKTIVLRQPDPTWEIEYNHFKDICRKKETQSLQKDKFILLMLNELDKQRLNVERSCTQIAI
jgi:predicted dehydrogenase